MKRLITIFVLFLVIFISGCTTNQTGKGDTLSDKTVQKGDTVEVNYIGTFNDGTVFDTSLENVAKESDTFNPQRPYEPLTFEVGAGQMIKGFDEAVVGMKEGETKKINLKPEEAYGESNPEMIKKVPLSAFKESGLPPVNTTVFFNGGLQGKVLKINNDSVTVDFNHEMAGKELNFEITLVNIQ